MQSALLVGLKRVDAAQYHGWTGEAGCWGCELDVENIERILQSRSFDVKKLLTAKAKADAVLEGLREAARRLKSGDTFVFYFSGHGGQKPDENGDEFDGQDETLVAYDREIIDDELNTIWMRFNEGVRIVMLSDSCNSGTNYRNIRDVVVGTPWKPIEEEAADTMRAQMIHMGGCRDGWSLSGYQGGGAFTQALCKVWDGGAFFGNYPEFYQQIRSRVTSSQIPQYNEYGAVCDAFRNEKPFTPGSRSGRSAGGDIVNVRCVLELPGGHLRDIKSAIAADVVRCLYDAIDDACSQRAGSASVSCTGSSSGDFGCTGTVTINF
ncbi:MAG: caspase family protein [Planctomycetales bacterium]|nr:caspase family protein [Planctomycetales bacterium]